MYEPVGCDANVERGQFNQRRWTEESMQFVCVRNIPQYKHIRSIYMILPDPVR